VPKPKIALIGSRGIPPKYGGAETFVYELSKKLKKLLDVYVTCESDHFGVDECEGIKRVHIWAKQTPTITIPIIYDIIATLYLIRKAKDVRLFYYIAPDGAYAALIAKLAGRKTIVNTDGIEWKRLLARMRFAPPHLKPIYLLTACLLIIAEFLACRVPDVTIADSLAIKEYLKHRWRPRKLEYVAYGARKLPQISEEKQLKILEKLGLERYKYYLTIGRLVAENGIHLEIEAFKKVETNNALVIVGPLNPRDPYVRYLIKLKGKDSRIKFLGGIYDYEIVYTLRANCRAYIHPYTVGGTNPSLLEQMLYSRPIIAYDVPFHREILREKGYYFKTTYELVKIIENMESNAATCDYIENLTVFSWDFIANRYIKLFREIFKKDYFANI
jgi:glycosyltransferase involved in cell wall biosynthesis